MCRVWQQEDGLDVGEMPVDDRHRRLVGDIDLGADALDEHTRVHVARVVDEQAHAPGADDDIALHTVLGDGLLQQREPLSHR
ncbi:hypothetical protein ABE10_10585 [Bacillus toyonensis]|nr:hypothetical protein [Bacillus toyonensis]